MSFSKALVAVLLCAVSAQATCPANATAVAPFNLQNYLGVWYQIADTAKFNNRTEKGADCVYANYTLEDASTVRVENIGFRNGAVDKAVGKAKQVVPNTGALKVSFFGPFYGPYTIINLQSDSKGDYALSLVYSCSETFGVKEEDLWILSRTREISESSYQGLQTFAAQVGIDLAALGLIKTKQTGCAPLPPSM